MFTVMKIREGMASDDYRDPGPYKNPERTVAYEVDATGAPVPASSKPKAMPDDMKGMKGMNMKGMNGMKGM
jgi:hypothetical protein